MPKLVRIQQETTKPKIKPDYSLIKSYFNGTESESSINAAYFKEHYDYYTSKPEFKNFTQLLEESGLLDDHNLYFFWVWYFEGADMYKYFKENEMFKILNSSQKDIVKLKETFTDIKLSYRPNSRMLNSPERLFLKSISFELINSKGIPKTATLKAHPLMYNLFLQLEKYVLQMELPDKPKEKNVKAYLNNFILSTMPIFNYLKETHFKDKSKNKVYGFMDEFITTVGINLEKIYPKVGASEHIKSIFTKRGKSTS